VGGQGQDRRNCLSPGAETKGRLLPKEDYGVDKRIRHEGENENSAGGGARYDAHLRGDKEYSYSAGGETRYIKLSGSMKGYTNANTAHQKRVHQMGFVKDYFIPHLPEYMYEIAKFPWVPSPKDKTMNGYYEGIARVRKADGTYIFVRVSLLT
jgi:hypothetical protein